MLNQVMLTVVVSVVIMVVVVVMMVVVVVMAVAAAASLAVADRGRPARGVGTAAHSGRGEQRTLSRSAAATGIR
jgi:hypothetical protein